MFENIIATLQLQGEEKPAPSKRRAPRRSCDSCVSVINGTTYPVENWSTVGVLVFGDSKPFGLDNEVDVTMKFKLRDEVVDIAHRAKVIRKTYDHVALEFKPLTDAIKNTFQNVIDDYLASQFADSQLT